VEAAKKEIILSRVLKNVVHEAFSAKEWLTSQVEGMEKEDLERSRENRLEQEDLERCDCRPNPPEDQNVKKNFPDISILNIRELS
jgi:hypothetical protein